MDPVSPLLLPSDRHMSEAERDYAASQLEKLGGVQLHQLGDVFDRTTVGRETKWIRYGIGAAGGLVVGFLVAKALG